MTEILIDILRIAYIGTAVVMAVYMTWKDSTDPNGYWGECFFLLRRAKERDDVARAKEKRG